MSSPNYESCADLRRCYVTRFGDISAYRTPKKPFSEDFPQFFPQVWKTLVRDRTCTGPLEEVGDPAPPQEGRRL